MSDDSAHARDRADTPPPTGNRCGHDPLAPRFFEAPADHGDRPPIIRKWIDRCRDFYRDPAKIPSLANALFARKQAADPDGDHTPRQMRSERREACCALLGAIAHYCDLPSLCLSVPQPDGSLLPIRMATLAERAGLSLRRAERAMRDIVTGGLLGVHPRCEQQEDGRYIGRAAIRVVPPSVFGLFGLEARLEHDRRRISQKRREALDSGSPNRTAAARIKIGVRSALDRVFGVGSPSQGPRSAPIPLNAMQAPQFPPPAVNPDIQTQTPMSPHANHIATMRAILLHDGPRHDAAIDGQERNAPSQSLMSNPIPFDTS
jgi:hypothetical protein